MIRALRLVTDPPPVSLAERRAARVDGLPSPHKCWEIANEVWGADVADWLFPQGEPPKDAA